MTSRYKYTIANSDGLEQLMLKGEIEIMRLVWAHGPMKIGPIYRAIRESRVISYTTITTQCYRMVERGLLARTKTDQYGDFLSATITEQDLVAKRLAEMLDSISQVYPDAVAHYAAARRQVGA